MRTARLLFPAIRARPDGGFDASAPEVEAALEQGVGGFILFGGTADAVLELTTELRRRSDRPLLFGADLERGAGQQFAGATRLPPAAALGRIDDPEVTRAAGELTAREAVALGVRWVYAPVADLDVEPENPIVGTRAFSPDADRVAVLAREWIRGCRAAGGLACAKHFPGHGRTVADSHLELPRVDASGETIRSEMRPFRAAIEAGVDSIMTAHVAYPGLDASSSPATLSPRIIGELLRDELGFGGIVVTDALIMEGVLEDSGDEGDAAVRAVAAGCDALLYPDDPERVVAALDAAIGGRLAAWRMDAAIRRVEAVIDRAGGPASGDWGRPVDRAWALDVATRSLDVARGEPAGRAGRVEVVTVDDDLGGPAAPPPREAFVRALGPAGIDARAVDAASGESPVIIAVYADIRAWKGRPGISDGASSAVAAALRARPDAVIVLFGHPRLAADLPGGEHVLVAWGGEPLMQEAAARWLGAAGRSR